MSKEPTTTIERFDPSEYPALAGYADLVESITANASGALNAGDLTRYKTVSGVDKFINVDTGEVVDTLTGIIVSWTPSRSYWPGDDAVDGTPPACSSTDGKIGIGVRFAGDSDGSHNCASCPMAQFGSSTKAKSEGQACKEFRQVLLLEPGRYLPTLLRIPPTSLKPFSKYMVSLISINKPFFTVLTRIGLKVEESASGYKVAIMQFTGLDSLDEPSVNGARSIRGALSGFTPAAIGSAPSDVGGDEEPF